MKFIKNTDTIDINAKSLGVHPLDGFNDRGLCIQIRHNGDPGLFRLANKISEVIVEALNEECGCEACDGMGYLEVTHEDNCQYIEACESCDYFGIMGSDEEINAKAREKARRDGVKMTAKGKVKY
jgi:hypothetical protein